MAYRILLLPGDGIGPEIMAAGRQVLETLAHIRKIPFQFEDGLIGGAAIDETGTALPEDVLEKAKAADAVLLGAVGGPKWSALPGDKRPEAGLLTLRKALSLYANLRPIKVHKKAAAHSPVKPERVEGTDILFVRELTGGLYFGEKGIKGDTAFDTCTYHRHEIERVIHLAAQMARERRGKLTLVDKANVMETSRLWRRLTQDIISSQYPDITLDCLLVDAAAMHLITRPRDFDVIVTENLFGDILSDEASVLAGSIGLLPSASLGDGTAGLYEPIHGSAPDIAGSDRANPIGMIESIAMLLTYSLGKAEEANALNTAVAQVLDGEHLPTDLGGTTTTSALADQITAKLEQILADDTALGHLDGPAAKPACIASQSVNTNIEMGE